MQHVLHSLLPMSFRGKREVEDSHLESVDFDEHDDGDAEIDDGDELERVNLNNANSPTSASARAQPSNAAELDDIDEFKDQGVVFHISTRGRLGWNRRLCSLVMDIDDATQQPVATILILHPHTRKMKHEFSLNSITQLQIPAVGQQPNTVHVSKKSETPSSPLSPSSPMSSSSGATHQHILPAVACEVILIFGGFSRDGKPHHKPFSLLFNDEFDRFSFCVRVVQLSAGDIIIRDMNLDVADPDAVRFSVLTASLLGRKTKKVIELRGGGANGSGGGKGAPLLTPPVLRCYDVSSKDYTDTPFHQIMGVDVSYDDSCVARVLVRKKGTQLLTQAYAQLNKMRALILGTTASQLHAQSDSDTGGGLGGGGGGGVGAATIGTGGVDSPTNSVEALTFTFTDACAREQFILRAQQLLAVNSDPSLSLSSVNSTSTSALTSSASTTTFASSASSTTTTTSTTTTSTSASSPLSPTKGRPVVTLNTSSAATSSHENKAHSAPSPTAASASTPPSTSSSTSSHAQIPFSVFVGSWNQGGAAYSPISLSDFLPPKKYDIYAIGLQECSELKRDEWLLEFTAHIVGDSAKKLTEEEKEYVVLNVEKLWNIVLIILIKRPLLQFVSNLETSTIATGVGGILGNKGGVGISFRFRGVSLCFINCHLAARANKIVERKQNYNKIARSLRMGNKDCDVLNQFDHVFWFGDLNYRTEKTFEEVAKLIQQQDWLTLYECDQLKHEIANGSVFAGFKEGALNFAPTYRWDRHLNVLSNKKNQSPSWCDRVMWKSLPGLDNVALKSYTGCPDIWLSDHRPVNALFEVTPQPPWGFRVAAPLSQSKTLVLHSVKLISTVIDPSSVITLTVCADWIYNSENSASIEYSETDKCWTWPVQHQIVLVPFIDQQSFATPRHVRVVVSKAVQAKDKTTGAPHNHPSPHATFMGHDFKIISDKGGAGGVGGDDSKEDRDNRGDSATSSGTRIGNCVFALKKALNGAWPSTFEGTVSAEGQHIGHLFGKITEQLGTDQMVRKVLKVHRIPQKKDQLRPQGQPRTVKKIVKGIKKDGVPVSVGNTVSTGR